MQNSLVRERLAALPLESAGMVPQSTGVFQALGEGVWEIAP